MSWINFCVWDISLTKLKVCVKPNGRNPTIPLHCTTVGRHIHMVGTMLNHQWLVVATSVVRLYISSCQPQTCLSLPHGRWHIHFLIGSFIIQHTNITFKYIKQYIFWIIHMSNKIVQMIDKTWYFRWQTCSLYLLSFFCY